MAPERNLSPVDNDPSMGPLPAELQIALVRLDGDLRRLAQSIQALLHLHPRGSGGDMGLPGSAAAAQYRALEEAIAARTPHTAPARALTEVRTPVPVQRLGRWTLCDDGWTLIFPDGIASLTLEREERAVLLQLARSPVLRISREDIRRLLEAVWGAQAPQSWHPHRFATTLVRRLRSKTRALGEKLPLQTVRGWGYQFDRAAPAIPVRRWANHTQVPGAHVHA